MLSWALTFLVVALIAAALGFGGVAGEAAWVAHVLFVIFLVLFVVSPVATCLTPEQRLKQPGLFRVAGLLCFRRDDTEHL
jgi:uncharacterized membrane protein YtjA (UPF0391 family)